MSDIEKEINKTYTTIKRLWALELTVSIVSLILTAFILIIGMNVAYAGHIDLFLSCVLIFYINAFVSNRVLVKFRKEKAELRVQLREYSESLESADSKGEDNDDNE